MKFLRNPERNVEGFTRQVGNGIERLRDYSGNTIAVYRSSTDSTFDLHGNRVGNGNRLAGLVEQKPK